MVGYVVMPNHIHLLLCFRHADKSINSEVGEGKPIYDSSTSGVVIADNSDIDPLIENYIKYYNILLNYAGGYMSDADSIMIDSLAGLCPMEQGAVVYSARSLWQLLHNRAAHFEESCGEEHDSLWIKPAAPQPYQPFAMLQGAENQAYNLLPNPNNGNFSIQQLVADERPVDIEICNAVGQSLYKTNIVFKNGRTDINSRNLAPGTYLLKMKEKAGKHHIIKFTVL